MIHRGYDVLSEVEILVLVAPGKRCGKQRNYKLQACQFEWGLTL